MVDNSLPDLVASPKPFYLLVFSRSQWANTAANGTWESASFTQETACRKALPPLRDSQERSQPPQKAVPRFAESSLGVPAS
jgi:hypothetical protein